MFRYLGFSKNQNCSLCDKKSLGVTLGGLDLDSGTPEHYIMENNVSVAKYKHFTTTPQGK